MEYAEKKWFSVSIVFVLLFLVVSCKRDSSSLSLQTARETITISNTKNGKVDVLFVIDSSGSMGDDQEQLANNIHIMVDTLVARGLSFNVAATTTDIPAEGGSFHSYFPYHATANPYQDAGCSAVLANNEYVVSSSDPDIKNKMYCKMMVGVAGSGTEQGADAIKLALSEPNLSGNNANFLREDSFLGIVVISDEEDASVTTSTEIVDFLSTVTKWNPNETARPYSINAIVHQEARNCAGAAWAGYLGGDYLDMATLSEGEKGNLCGDFAEIVQKISDGIAKATSEIRLDRPAEPNSVRVWLNGVEVPKSATQGFQYIPNRQSVQFNGSWIPKPGDELGLEYDPTTPII